MVVAKYKLNAKKQWFLYLSLITKSCQIATFLFINLKGGLHVTFVYFFLLDITFNEFIKVHIFRKGIL